MYYCYIYNNELKENNILCIENTQKNLNNLIRGYCEMIIANFLDGFTNDFNHLIISNYKINQNPLNNYKHFEIKLNDYNNAKNILAKKWYY